MPVESLDREIAKAFTEQPLLHGPAQILLVGATAKLGRSLGRKLSDRGHGCESVRRLDEAKAAVSRTPFDLVLLDPVLPDGNGLELAAQLRKTSATKTIVLARAGSFEQSVEALRCGVVDFVDAQTPVNELAKRIDSAIRASRSDTQRERRLDQLKVVCK